MNRMSDGEVGHVPYGARRRLGGFWWQVAVVNFFVLFVLGFLSFMFFLISIFVS